MELYKYALALPLLLVVFTNTSGGDLFGTLRNIWYNRSVPPPPQQDRGGGGSSGQGFLPGAAAASSRNGLYEDPSYMMMSGSGISQRGWGGGGGGWGWGHDDHQNLDLYSLLGGLSFASLLGATIIYLARRNTSGRRRRSADGMRYLEEDEFDQSDNAGLNIIDLIDSFLDSDIMMSEKNNLSSNSSSVTSLKKVHLGPGVVPHEIVKH